MSKVITGGVTHPSVARGGSGNIHGYDFYFEVGKKVYTLPITPSELTIKVDSNNKVVSLVSGGDINILKSPSLIEVEFDARFPMRQYPYARKFTPFEEYRVIFEDLKEQKKSFRFIVARNAAQGGTTWDTNLLMALESYELKESADEGDDVIVSFKLKQYKEYGIKQVKVKNDKPQSTKTPTRKSQEPSAKTYTVKKGDCLWNIAKAQYGDATKWKKIYEANKTVIENTAKKYGKKSSSNGHWIYPGTKLTIPAK